MNRKHQTRMESVQHIISLEGIKSEITRTEAQIASARDSMNDFWYVLTLAFLIGITSIGTAIYNGAPVATSAGHGLQLSLAAFAVFYLYTMIFDNWRSIRPNEEYITKLQVKLGSLIQDQKRISAGQHTKPTPRAQEDEFV